MNAPTPISVTGHSLGGALSPAVALWLSDTKAQWDPSGRSSLACLPSAGPTSGDQAFATYYMEANLRASRRASITVWTLFRMPGKATIC
ncbi:MAG: lipase family protein [Pyrinomonadaceae bacterium]